MPNEREDLIDKLLAEKTQIVPRDPGCPNITDLLGVALEQARPEVVTLVKQHTEQCRDCAHLVAAYRATLADEEAEEASLDGTLLKRVAQEIARPHGGS